MNIGIEVSSIKNNLDLSKIFDIIEKNINLNIDTMRNKTPGGSFTFDFDPLGKSHKSGKANETNEYANPYSNNRDYENPYDTPDGYESENRYGSSDSLLRPEEHYRDNNYREKESMKGEIDGVKEDAIGGIKGDISKGELSGESTARTNQSRKMYSKNISSKKLRDAIVWSEILGPPVSKRR